MNVELAEKAAHEVFLELVKRGEDHVALNFSPRSPKNVYITTVLPATIERPNFWKWLQGVVDRATLHMPKDEGELVILNETDTYAEVIFVTDPTILEDT